MAGPYATIGELKAAAIRAGLPPDDRVNVAAAIAMAESGGDLTAHNDTPPDDSYGPWQINRLAHPQYSPAELQTLEGNARAMAQVSGNGTNWRPWSMYKNGRYRNHLQLARATPAATSSPFAGVTATGSATVGGAGAGLDPLTGAALGPAGSWIADMFGLDQVGERIIVAGITLILTASAAALIGLGLLRLTGTDPSRAVALAGTAAAL